MSRKWTTDEFIKESKNIHGENYNYSLTNYTDSYSKITIICPKHGIFHQRANHHMQGHGCPYCSIKITTDIFIKNARRIHGDRYNYNLTNYTNKRGKIKIICKYHGVFVQSARNHLRGQNCPRCKNYISKKEILFLDLVKIDNDNRQLFICGYKVDGYDPSTNTIYEFLGDYWHGNPTKFNGNDLNKSCNNTFKDLYKKTLLKFDSLKSKGYHIKYIWETDWNLYVSKKISYPLISKY